MRHRLEFGAFEIDSFPGNSQLAICHHFLVLKTMRGNGYGHILKNWQHQVLNQHHYGYTLATVASHNVPQIKCMEKGGWKLLDTFWNDRNNETTTVWGKLLDAGRDLRGVVKLIETKDEEKIRQLRARIAAAENWYCEEYDVDPHGEGIDIVYPWDHTGDT